MEFAQGAVDLLRAAHLICFAAGMGTALYFDFHSFWSLKRPIDDAHLAELARIHHWVSAAFIGLWLTGLGLIYVRTGFEFANFSPKLWLKVGLMVLMTFNSVIIARVIVPLMRANLNSRLVDLRYWQFCKTTQIAIISMFCWTAGLFLGSSVTLKTAGWDLLAPMTISWLFALTISGQLAARVMYQRVRGVQAS